GKLIPAATGLKQYRSVDVKPSEKIPMSAYRRPESEGQLLAAVVGIGRAGGEDRRAARGETGADGGGGASLSDLGLDFGGAVEPDGDPSQHESGEAIEIPELDSPPDDE